jgi:hypothetical protein
MSLPIARFLSVIGLPHRDNVPRIPARRPNYDHHSPMQMSDADHSGFPIVAAQIGDIDRYACEHIGGIGEIEPPLLQGDVALARVEGDPHPFNVATKTPKGKPFVATLNGVGLPAGAGAMP